MASSAIASPPPEPTQYMPAALVTPDGNLVITSTVQNIPDGHGGDTTVAKIVELAARTGQLVRVLYTVTPLGVVDGGNGAGQLDQGCNVLSLGPAGVHALVACFNFGRVDDHRFTALPGFPSSSSGGIAGHRPPPGDRRWRPAQPPGWPSVSRPPGDRRWRPPQPPG